MSITIENITLTGARTRRKAVPKLGILAKNTVERYKKAYKRVYGIPPEIKYNGKWFRIKGHGTGVSRMRLKELAEQLEYRAGDE